MSSAAEKRTAWARIRRDTYDASAESEDSYVTAKDGHRVFHHLWKPSGPIRAQVVYFHGLGEHCMRYGHVFGPFSDAGILVRAIDWRGHGRTVLRNKNGVQGFHESFDTVFEDMIQVLGVPVEGATADTPLFVMGHSMGGLLALAFVHKYKSRLPNLRGCISQAPALAPGKPIPAFLASLIRLLGGVLGKVTQPNELDLEGLCSSDPVVEAYLKDPFNHGLISFRLAKDMLVHQKMLLDSAGSWNTPLIMYHNCRDRFTDAKTSESYFNAASGVTDKKFYGFQESQMLEHEVHNEPSVSHSITSDYIEWIHDRAK
ncbi:Alpha/Beta hydrolase protein [Chytriomyces sp. MP71]|nr:Alpha/Beta hydrolase protein [Chytriomyces sp. MP71]